MQLTTGKLILRYVGKYGNHTSLHVHNKEYKSYYCNKSIMLYIWIVSDILGITVEEVINSKYKYESSGLCTIYHDLFNDNELFSKYDILYNCKAIHRVYSEFISKYSVNLIDKVLSAKQDLILYVQKEYKIDNLEIIYELNEEEIYD